MTPPLPRRRMLIAASCTMPFAGCSVLPSPPVSQIYRLTPVADDPPRRRILHRRLVVDIPTASESLDTDRIALIRDRTRFDYFANSLWTDRVPLLVQALLVEAFENDGSIAQVARDAQTLTPDYLLANGNPQVRSGLCRLGRSVANGRRGARPEPGEDAGPSDARSHADNGIGAGVAQQCRQRRRGV